MTPSRTLSIKPSASGALHNRAALPRCGCSGRVSPAPGPLCDMKQAFAPFAGVEPLNPAASPGYFFELLKVRICFTSA